MHMGMGMGMGRPDRAWRMRGELPPLPREGESAGRRLAAPKLIPRLLGTAVRSSPLATAGLSVSALGDGAIAAGQLLVTQRLIDTLQGVLQQGALQQSGAAPGANPWGAVVPWVLAMAGVAILSILLEMLKQYCEVSVQEKVGIHLQRQVIEKAHSVELVYFEHPDFYDALQRANQDMGSRLVTLLRLVTDIVSSFAGMAGIILVLWQAHWSLAPITVLGVAPGFWVMLKMRKKTYWVYRMRTPESRLAMYLNGLMTRRDEAKEVRLFTLGGHILNRWLSLSKAIHAERRRLEVKQAWLGLLTDGIRTASYAGCLALLAVLVAGARITFGMYAVIMQALQQFSHRIEQVMRNVSGLHEQSLYLADLYEFLEYDVVERLERAKAGQGHPPEPGRGRGERRRLSQPPEANGAAAVEPAGAARRAAQGAPKPAAAGALAVRDGVSQAQAQPGEVPPAADVELRGVWFRYPGSERWVLQDINLTIAKGERIALIGENGAGKSTLVRLIMGLYAPTQGQILIDGTPVAELPEPVLRSYFAAVFQEFVRYQFPVADNIRFGRLASATDADVEWAASLSGVAQFVERLPERYATMLGRPLGGVDLSGGEWQKLAIARALVRRAPIVILDEPTAALDPKAEAEIYEQFGEMTTGRTSILISHRLGSARMADRIVVLKGGRIVEIGSHDELVRQGGEYARMFALQAQWYQ